MKIRFIPVLFLAVYITWFPGLSAAETFQELDLKHLDEVVLMLPEKPLGFGKPCNDRKFWEDPAVVGRFKKNIASAEKILPQKMPAWSDDAYLEFSRNGKRTEGQKMQGRRSGLLCPLVLAECVENKGRFTAKINDFLEEYAGEPTWTMPAHDRSLDNYNCKSYSVDLRSSAFGFELAQALYLLGDKVSPATREKIVSAIQQRVFAPVRRSLETGKGNGWLGSKTRPVQNNWNAVCLAGVTGAALSLLPDRHERAVFVAASEHYSRYYINSFWEDGYCDEGVGYWNYGFGCYIDLREILIHATNGGIDLFCDPRIRNAAMYGPRIQIVEGVVPAFADCHIGSRPSGSLIEYCNWVLELGLGNEQEPKASGNNLTTALIDPMPSKVKTLPGNRVDGILALRTYFDKAGVLVCRPAAGSSCRMAVAIKAGGNGSHSHNDIGSFTVVQGKEQPVGEPGGPHAYTKQTFSKERYDLKLLNSFGHPVPVVAGTLQLEATKVHPRVISTNFTDAADEISMDIACAYKVPELQKLVRTMRYDRGGSGSVVISDDVMFSRPCSFELGLPTNGKWKQIGPETLEFSMGKERVLAEIKTPDGFEVTSEIIDEQSKPPFPRVGIKLNKPVQGAKVVVSFRPTS